MAGSTAVTARHLVQATHVKATRAHPLTNAPHMIAEKLAADSAFCMILNFAHQCNQWHKRRMHALTLAALATSGRVPNKVTSRPGARL